MNRLRDMDTGFGVHVYRKPDLALVLGETGQRLDRTLSSLVAANVLVRAARGVYAFAWSAHPVASMPIGRPRSGCRVP